MALGDRQAPVFACNMVSRVVCASVWCFGPRLPCQQVRLLQFARPWNSTSLLVPRSRLAADPRRLGWPRVGCVTFGHVAVDSFRHDVVERFFFSGIAGDGGEDGGEGGGGGGKDVNKMYSDTARSPSHCSVLERHCDRGVPPRSCAGELDENCSQRLSGKSHGDDQGCLGAGFHREEHACARLTWHGGRAAKSSNGWNNDFVEKKTPLFPNVLRVFNKNLAKKRLGMFFGRVLQKRTLTTRSSRTSVLSGDELVSLRSTSSRWKRMQLDVCLLFHS